MDAQTKKSDAQIQAAAIKVAPLAESLKARMVKMDSLSLADPVEFRDTVEDLLKIIIIIEEPLKDGFQWMTDLIAFLRAQPLVQEIINDFPAFYQELVNIIGKDPATAVTAIRAAYFNVKLSETFGKVSTVIANGLFVLANNADAAYQVYDLGLLQKNLWEGLIGGKNILEELA